MWLINPLKNLYKSNNDLNNYARGSSNGSNIMRIRDGKTYIKEISKEREVYVNGECVNDVTKHSAFKSTINSIAMLYDLQHHDKYKSTLLTECPITGNIFPTSYMPPRNQKELIKRHNAFKLMSDATFGMMGRSPDFLNSAVMAFSTSNEFFYEENKSYSDNIKKYYEYCRSNDLFLSHAAINPQVNRSKSANEEENAASFLHVVSENKDGIYVQGAKLIATLAPIADELLVFNMPGLKKGDESYALFFAIPISTHGLKLITREPLNLYEYSHFDHPLSTKFDEIDSSCIFDNVFVPWERVFIYKNVEKSNKLYDATFTRHHTGQQGIIRGLSKAEFLVSIAIKIAKVTGTDSFLHVRQKLGEIIAYLELVKGAINLSEAEATVNCWGVLTPSIQPILSLRCHFPKMYQEIVDFVKMLGAGGLFSTPMENDFKSEIEGLINQFYIGIEISAYQKAQLMKLALDATCSMFAQRQILYEFYHAGDPVRLADNIYNMQDFEKYDRLVNRALCENSSTIENFEFIDQF